MLSELISRYVPLKQNGSSLVGRCPFHDDEGESLRVGDTWRCVACGAHEDGPDAIGWLMSWSGCSREDAVEQLSNGSLPDPKPILVQPLKRPPFWGIKALVEKPSVKVWIHDTAEGVAAGRLYAKDRVHLGLCHGRSFDDLSCVSGRDCILFPANDRDSLQTMQTLAELLYAAGHKTVRWVDPEALGEGRYWPGSLEADAAVAYARRHVKPYIAPEPKIAPAAPERAVAPEPASPAPASDKPKRAKPALAVVDGAAVRKPDVKPDPEQLPAFSEFALATRFAAQAGEDWRYTHAWQIWAKWNGIRWVPDETRHITWEVRECCTAAMNEHVADSTPAQRVKLASLKTVYAVTVLAGSDPGIAVAPQEWDADTMLLGTPAGIIDLRSGKLVPSERNQLISKSTSVAPVVGEHPWWDKVLARTTVPAEFLQLWCGYMLTGDTREERFLFIHGPGAAGKSKFLTPLAEIMGDYRRTAKTDSFTHRERTEHPEEIARLAGARLVTAIETEEGSRWNEARITALTGRDTIAARHMHKSTFEFQPQFKLVFVGNHRPALRSVGEEMRRRIDLVEWGGTIPESERILDLPERLRAEYPAILAWMIEGCLRWQKEGLGKPEAVKVATTEYLQGEDTLGAWIEECIEPYKGIRTKSSDIYHSFKRWADACGEYVPSQKRFTQRLKDRGFETIKASGVMTFLDLRLKLTDAEMRETVGWTPD